MKCEKCGSHICAICGKTKEGWSAYDRGIDLQICHDCYQVERDKRKDYYGVGDIVRIRHEAS